LQFFLGPAFAEKLPGMPWKTFRLRKKAKEIEAFSACAGVSAGF